MFSTRFVASVAVLAIAFAATPAAATIVVASLPDFNGPQNTGGFPINLGTVGTFTFSIPGAATINSATLSGTYGTDLFSTSTAGFDASVDGTSIAVCVPLAANCWQTGAPLRSFSFALPSSVFASLLDGQANLDIIQTNEFSVRFGSPTLTIDFTQGAVPEPATWALMLVGFGAVGGAMRRRRMAKVAFS